MRTSVTAVIFVGAVVVRKGSNPPEILVIKRGTQPNKGSWSVPGGRLDFGETIADCAAREVLEETGVTAKVGPVITALDSILTNKSEFFDKKKHALDSIEFHYVIVDVVAFAPENSVPKPGDDAADAMWISEAKLSKLTPLSSGLGLLKVVRSALSLLENKIVKFPEDL